MPRVEGVVPYDIERLGGQLDALVLREDLVHILVVPKGGERLVEAACRLIDAELGRTLRVLCVGALGVELGVDHSIGHCAADDPRVTHDAPLLRD